MQLLGVLASRQLRPFSSFSNKREWWSHRVLLGLTALARTGKRRHKSRIRSHLRRDAAAVRTAASVTCRIAASWHVTLDSAGKSPFCLVLLERLSGGQRRAGGKWRVRLALPAGIASQTAEHNPSTSHSDAHSFHLSVRSPEDDPPLFPQQKTYFWERVSASIHNAPGVRR